MPSNTGWRARRGTLVPAAIVMAASCLSLSFQPSRAELPSLALDVADTATRCAIERATARLADVTALQVMEAAGLLEGFLAVADGQPAPDAEATRMLVALGVLTQDGAYLSDFGQSVKAYHDSRLAVAGQAVMELVVGGSSYQDTASSGGTSGFRIDTSGMTGGTLLVRLTPEAGRSAGCADFDPLVRASVAGAGVEWIARGMGDGRVASLYLHDLPAGAAVDVRVADVVGADGRYTIEAIEVPRELPAVDDTTAGIAVGSGATAWLPLELGGEGGEVAAFRVMINEVGEASLTVTGLGDAQPGVTVYAADTWGQPTGEPVMRSPFVPTMDRTVDLGHLLGVGSYVVTVEELQRRPADMLVAYTSSGGGVAVRQGGSFEIGGETPQALGSDLAFAVTELGWYAFTTWSYDEVDPVMSLSGADGMLLQENDDSAFSMHPLIIAELMPGDYGLTLDGFDGSSGDVTLGAWRIEPQSLELGTLGLEQTIANDLAQPPFNIYLVTTSGSELIELDVAPLGDSLDSTVALYDPLDMSVWNADDDGGIGYGSRIIDSLGGTTLLAVVSAYDAARGGAYALSLLDHAIVENIVETAIPVAAAGPGAKGMLAMDGDIAWFRLEAAPAGQHDITVQSPTMPYLFVELFLHEDGGYAWLDGMEGYDGLTELLLDTDGTDDVFILVRNPSGEGTGEFTLTVK